MIERQVEAHSVKTSLWLSLLVPVHNVESYIEDCLDSIISNIHSLRDDVVSKLELIVLDDGSSDGSSLIIEAYRNDYPQIITTLRHDEAQGVSAARNALVAQARGEYVWFVDADDMVADGAMARLLAATQTERPDYVICDYAVFSDRPESRSELSRKRTFKGPDDLVFNDVSKAVGGLFEGGYLHPWSKIHKRSLYSSDLVFPVGRIYEDVMLMPLLAMRAETFLYCPEVWLLHRKRPGSLIATPHPRKIEDKCYALAACAQELSAKSDGLSREAKSAFFYFMGRHLRVMFKQLARWPKPEEAKPFHRNILDMLDSLPPGTCHAIALSCLSRGRVGKLIGLWAWKQVANARLVR